MEFGGFDIGVEGGAGRDIGEGGRGGLVEGPGVAEDDQFSYLGAGGRVEGAEGVVRVAGDD